MKLVYSELRKLRGGERFEPKKCVCSRLKALLFCKVGRQTGEVTDSR